MASRMIKGKDLLLMLTDDTGSVVLPDSRFTISKRRNHDHFWIEDEILYESYRTLRGLRFQEVMEVPGMPDIEGVTDEGIVYIQDTYLKP